jgi:hypothetical protein
MGNIFSLFHFLEHKKRPNSLLGKKKPLIPQAVLPIYNMHPVYTAPLVTADEELLETTSHITYNSSPPFLISTVVSPLTEYHDPTILSID